MRHIVNILIIGIGGIVLFGVFFKFKDWVDTKAPEWFSDFFYIILAILLLLGWLTYDFIAV